MNLCVIIVVLFSLSSAAPLNDVTVRQVGKEAQFRLSQCNIVCIRQATLERAIEMMEGNDDWMNTLNFMMKNSTRG